MNRLNFSKNICRAAVATALLAPVPGLAVQIEEIVVTAQKREQSLNDVGIAVTAFTGADLKELGLSEPLDLAAQTPNLNINNTFGNSIPNVSIRGLGLNDYAVNNNPAAGVYVDEVYLVSPAMLTFQLYDVERVEVLKGPQGTLYGRNTTAGAVNFVSNKPTEEFTGSVSLDFGNFDLIAVDGVVSGKIADGLAGRIAVKTTQQREGHQDNRATGKDVGEIDRTSWRAMLSWQASDNLDLLLNVHSGRDKSDSLLLKVDNIFTPIDDAFFPGDPFDSSGRPDTFMDIESDGAALTVNWEYSDRITLTSITGYEDYSRRHVEDRDGTAFNQLDGEFLNDIEQFSQELRLTYATDELVLIAGLFYGTDEVTTRDRFDTEDFFLDGIFPFRAVGNEFTQETDSKAIYVHSEWQFNDEWRLTLGLRYTDEEKDFEDAFTFIYVDALPSNGGTELQVFAPVSNEYDVTDLSGKIGLDYSGIENTLLYASISKGFKSGNFQGQLTFLPSTLENFDEENVIAYEVGFKSQLLDRSMQLNGALFFYDYEDLQIYGPIFTVPIDPLFGITNAGDAEVMGAEIDLLWRATEQLDVRLGLGLLDTEITDPILSTIEKGSELPNSPELNFNANIKYRWNITPSLVGKVILDSSYKDDVNYDIVRQPTETKEDGYWLTNMHIGVEAENGTWSVHFWSKNITDEEYRTQVLTSTVGFGESWGIPRTYGVTLDYNW